MKIYGKRAISILLVILMGLGMLGGVVLPVSATEQTLTRVEIAAAESDNNHYSTPTANLFDRDFDVHWSTANGSTRANLTVTLAETENFSRIVLYPKNHATEGPASFPNGFTIAVSEDGLTYTVVKTVTGYTATSTDGQVFDLDIPQRAKYIKLGVTRTEGGWIQFGEIEVYASDTVPMKKVYTLVDITAAQASNSHDNFPPSMLFDKQGDTLLTHWSTNANKTAENVTVTLGTPEDVSRITLYIRPDNAGLGYFPKGVEILVSQDGESFTSVMNASVWTPTTHDPIHFEFPEQKNVKKIKLNVTRPTAGYIQIQEMEVYKTVKNNMDCKIGGVTVVAENAREYQPDNPPYVADMLVDGITGSDSSMWHSYSGVTSAYITFDLGESKTLSKMLAYARPTNLDRNIKNYQIWMSDTAPVYSGVDGETPIGLAATPTTEGMMNQCSAETPYGTIALPEGATGRYVTLYIQDLYDENSFNIREIEFYESLPLVKAAAAQVTALEVDYEANALILPEFAGVTTAILSSSDENVIATDGTVNAVKGGAADVVLQFTDGAGNAAATSPIRVFVMGLRQSMATAVQAENIMASTQLGGQPATSLIAADGAATSGTYGAWWSSKYNVKENELLFTLPEASDVTGVAVQPGNNLTYFPQEIEVLVSADNSVWTSVLTESGLTATDLNAYLNFYFDVQESVKYVKIITKTNQSYTSLGSIKALVAPTFETAAAAAEKLTVAQEEEQVNIGNLTRQFLAEITASDHESVVAGDGRITLPAEATEVSLTIKVTNRLDETDVATVTRTLKVKTQAMLEVDGVAKATDLIPWADRDATKITLPEVSEGYSIQIVESDHPEIVDLDGNITRRDSETVGVRLTFKITNNTTGLSANTKALLVPIYKTYVAPTMTQAQIEKIHQDYESMSYGVFVHYIAAYNQVSATKYRDGKEVTTVTELADAFDVAQFAKDMDAFGAEYVVFTVQHGDDVPLFPSITNQRWRADRRTEEGKPVCSERDVIDELLTALEPYGIDLHLYTRFDGYTHITCAEDKENLGGSDSGIFKTFVWERNYELVERYGDRIAGLWYDGMGSPSMFTMGEERAALTAMLRSFNPAMILSINSGFHDGETNLYSQMNFQDATAWEVNKWVSYREFPVSRHQTASCLASQYWWTRLPQTTTFEKQPLGEMFQYIVGLASISYEGGFLASTGIYAIEPEDHGKENDLWLNGMRDYLVSLNEDYLTPVAESVKNTSVGVAYPTTENITVNTMEWGVSTESRDGKTVYLHVINAPTGNTLSLPAPADGSLFAESATILNFDKTITEGVTITKTADGYDFTLPEGKTWDSVDTIIKLTRTGYDTAIPTYTGDKVFYDPVIKGVADGTVVVREIEGKEYYLTVGENVSGVLTDDCYPVIDGVTQVHFLAKEYQPFHLYLGDYALYGAKAGITPNDETDITKANASRASDTGETVLIGVDNASPDGQTYIGSRAKVTLDGFTFKGNAGLYLGTQNTEDKVGESITVNLFNCRNSTAEDAYALASATAFIYGNGAEHKIVNVQNNRFDGVCFSGTSATALFAIRNWEGVVENNYISTKKSVTIGNSAAAPIIFWLSGESYDGKDWSGKQDVTIQNNYLAGRVSTSVIPQWYDEYKVHILGNTIAPTVGGYSLINVYTAGSATVDGETKYYSNIDTADIKISGNKVINPDALSLSFVNIYGTVTATAADQVAEIQNYKAGNIKINYNELDYGTVSGNAFGGTAVTGYDNLVFDITCNKYGATVNPVKSGLEGNFAALSNAEEAAHKQVEIVEDVAPTLTTAGEGHKVCAFCGTVVEENTVLPAEGEAIIDTTGYATLEEALQASKAEDVIQLLNDVTAEELMVKNGVTLDLNGKTLTANYLVGFNGAVVVDATDTGAGKLAIAKENLALSKNNPQMPVYDEENGCYLFTRVKNDRFELTTEGNSPKYSTSPMFKDYVHSLMDTEDKAAASGVEVIIRLTWSDSDGQYRGQQDYIYYHDSVAQVMASYTNTDGAVNYANQFYGIFVGSEIESGVNVSVSTIVRSSAGVEMESTATALFTAE